MRLGRRDEDIPRLAALHDSYAAALFAIYARL